MFLVPKDSSLNNVLSSCRSEPGNPKNKKRICSSLYTEHNEIVGKYNFIDVYPAVCDSHSLSDLFP